MNASDNEAETVNITETSEQLNERYARELLPLSISLGLLTVFGVMGNILTLVVFVLSKDYRGNTFRVFVISLAIIDLITCLTLFPIEILTHRFFFAFKNALLCKAKCFIAVFGASSSSLTLLVISADRFRKAMFPLKKQLTPSISVKLSFLMALIIPTILSFPAMVMCGDHKTHKSNIFEEEIEVYVCETEEKYKTSILRTIYKLVLLILQLGISIVYFVLYPFVMKEAFRHIKLERSIRNLKSSYSESKELENIEINTTSITEGQTCDNVKEISNINEVKEGQNGRKTGAKSVKDTKHCKAKRHLSKLDQVSILSQTAKFPAKTLVWFLLTIVFVATFMTHLWLTLKVSETVAMSTKDLLWFLFCYRLYFINHVINPVVYAIFLKSFRSSCRHIFSRSN